MTKRSEEELKRINAAYIAASDAAYQSAGELVEIAREIGNVDIYAIQSAGALFEIATEMGNVDIYAQDSPWDHVHRASIFAAKLAQLVSLIRDKKKS